MSFQHITDRIGSLVASRYHVLRMLGEGGMGAVVEAEDTRDGGHVAVKLIKPEYAASEEVNARFVQEMQVLGAIRHPCVVEVLDAGQDEEGPYLVLELLRGETLCDVIARRALAPREALTILAHALDGLAAVHAAGIVHRDFKPENIFLVGPRDRWASVRLLDFGISKALQAKGALTRVGVAIGTPDYMSPEQASGAKVDARADLWSVGAVLYECLSQKRPFDGETYMELLARIMMKPPVPLASRRSDVPPGVVAVVERALQKSPKGRYQSAGEMLDAVRRALDALGPNPTPAALVEEPTGVIATLDESLLVEEPTRAHYLSSRPPAAVTVLHATSAPPPSPAASPPAPAHPRRAVVALAGAGAVVVAAVVAAAAMRRPEAPSGLTFASAPQTTPAAPAAPEERPPSPPVAPVAPAAAPPVAAPSGTFQTLRVNAPAARPSPPAVHPAAFVLSPSPVARPAPSPVARRPRPVARAPAAVSSTPISMAETMGAMRPLIPALRGCAQGQRGSLGVTFDVDARGGVRWVQIDRPFAGTSAEPCMLRVLRRARFPEARPNRGVRFMMGL